MAAGNLLAKSRAQCKRGVAVDARSRRRSCRLSVERLEERRTPAVLPWYDGTGDWEDDRNWTGTPDVPDDYAGFDGSAATTNDVAQSPWVHKQDGGQILALGAGTREIIGKVVVDGGVVTIGSTST